MALEANGSPAGSFTGSASMSARSATTGPGLPPLQHGDDAGLGDAGLHLEAKLRQVLGNERRRPRLLFAEFGMLVNVAAPGDQLLLDLRGALADFLFQLRDIGCARAGRADRERDCAENESSSDDVRALSPPRATRLGLPSAGVCGHCGRSSGAL